MLRSHRDRVLFLCKCSPKWIIIYIFLNAVKTMVSVSSQYCQINVSEPSFATMTQKGVKWDRLDKVLWHCEAPLSLLKRSYNDACTLNGSVCTQPPYNDKNPPSVFYLNLLKSPFSKRAVTSHGQRPRPQ